MVSLVKNLRKEADRLLTEGKVKHVIGYEMVEPLNARPFFAKSANDVNKLNYSPLCAHNLAVYLTLEEIKAGEKIGLVVKGCDSRAVTQLVQEGIVDREKVVLIGVPCQGIVNLEKLREELDERNVQSSSATGILIENGVVKVETENGIIKLDRKEIVFDICNHCQNPTPLLYDILLGEEVKPWGKENYEDVREIERMDLKKRWNYWKEKLSKCVRCYACREVCPLCYCKECLVDKTMPTWVRKSVVESENAFFHLMRVFHLAGRCVGCVACERSCPVGIPLSKLFRKMEKDVKKLFDYKAGMGVEQKPLLASFKLEDPEEFIK